MVHSWPQQLAATPRAPAGADAEPKAVKGGKVTHHGVKRTPITDARLLADIEGLRAGCVVCELRPGDAAELGLVPTGALCLVWL